MNRRNFLKNSLFYGVLGLFAPKLLTKIGPSNPNYRCYVFDNVYTSKYCDEYFFDFHNNDYKTIFTIFRFKNNNYYYNNHNTNTILKIKNVKFSSLWNHDKNWNCGLGKLEVIKNGIIKPVKVKVEFEIA